MNWLADKIEQWPTAKLLPYARNSRTHSDEQVAQVAASIREFGFTNPVLVDAEGGIIAGHGRVMAARKLGMDKVPCIRLAHLTEAQRRAYVIADNKLALNAGWDEKMLALELQDLQGMDFDLSLTGFLGNEIDELLAGMDATPECETDADAVPEVQAAVVSSLGDIWTLGKHRIMCGSSTDAGAIARLMSGAKANCSVTSPPYAMQRKESYGGIEPDKYPHWFAAVAKNVMEILADDGSFFVNIKEHVENGERSLYVYETIKELRKIGWRYVDQLIWAKPGLPGGWSNRLKNDFEPIHFFTKQEKITYMVQLVDVDNSRIEEMNDPALVDMYEDIYHFTKRTKIKFNPRSVGKKSDAVRVYSKSNESVGKTGNISISGKMKSGIARPGNVLWLQGNTESINHTAMYPVSLPTFFIKLVTDTGDAVFEPFSGSGTTIIAAEQTGRRCYAMELSPQYVDVAVRRWQQFTGKRATLEATGAEFPG